MENKKEVNSVKGYNPEICPEYVKKVEMEINVRYALGNPGNNPLVVLAMNPSTANKEEPDLTTTRILSYIEKLNKDIERTNLKINEYNSVISKKTNNDYKEIKKIQKINGWLVFNLYPERATNPYDLNTFNKDIFSENLKQIETYIKKFNIKELWMAWGDVNGKTLIDSKEEILEYLYNKIGEIKYFTFFSKLTNSQNPPHPINTQINKNIHFKNKNEIIIKKNKTSNKDEYILELSEKDSKIFDTLIGELDKIDNIQQYELINIIESLNKKIEEYNLNYNPKYEK